MLRSELLRFETKALELQGATIFRHCTYKRVTSAVWESGFYFDRDGDHGTHLT